ncbi:MAG: hypothetical protein HKN70_10255 [Gammaproteobacteria bacterium]|nr:hypothetical protein [Gammaproteobacteria bacterium]NNF17120.1 hypothetical protein [Gammaproteobacteria bacterium]
MKPDQLTTFAKAVVVAQRFALSIITISVVGCVHDTRPDSGRVVATNLPVVKIEKTDQNGDGNIDITEFNTRLETLFESRDSDRDGLVSMDDLPKVNTDAYQAADLDGDSKLTEKEYRILRQMDFRRVDTDNDEILVPHEILSW